MSYYGYIYKVTDLLNLHGLSNPVYIGQRKGTFNPEYYGSGIYIKPVVKNSGKQNFKLELLVCASSKEDLDKQEILQIKENNCIWPNGYNLTSGGESGTGCHYHRPSCKCAPCKKKRGEEIIVSLETRLKLSKARQRRLNKPCSEATKQKIRIANTGFIKSPETIEKHRQKLKGRHFSKEHKAKIRASLLRTAQLKRELNARK